jgi:hypothetical protein
MRSLVLSMVVAAMAGCAGTDWTQDEQLIPDSEIDSQQSKMISTDAPPAAVQGTYVKIVWGYLAGRLVGAPGWIDWSGSLAVDSGTCSLDSLVFFDAGDTSLPSSAANEIDWHSRTLPHYDGVIALVQPGAASDVVHLTTPPFSKDIAAADLAKGLNDHEVVDADQHEVSITSIPAGAGGGFTYGYERKHPLRGWLGFGGLFTDPEGNVIGRLRFRVEGSGIVARLTDLQKSVLAEGSGTMSDQTFDLSLQKTDGSSYGTVSGIYQPPSYAVRGAFQATWKAP